MSGQEPTLLGKWQVKSHQKQTNTRDVICPILSPLPHEMEDESDDDTTNHAQYTATMEEGLDGTNNKFCSLYAKIQDAEAGRHLDPWLF
jgi:hypothetical protein